MTTPPIAGWNMRVPRGQPLEARRASRGAACRTAATPARPTIPSAGVAEQLRRVNQVVGRHAEQRLVAEDRTLDDHRRDRCHHCRPEERRVHVADDLLEREQHGGDRRVERRRQRAGGAHWHQLLHAFRRQAEPSSDHRGDAGADLHRWSLAPHRVARPDAEHAGQELANRHAGRNHASRSAGRRPRSAARRCRARPGRPWPAGCRSRRSRAAGTRNSRSRRRRKAEQSRLVRSIASVNRTADSPARMPTTIDSARNSWCLAQPELLRTGENLPCHCGSSPWRRPMRSSARSGGAVTPHADSTPRSMR